MPRWDNGTEKRRQRRDVGEFVHPNGKKEIVR
jgi:hypothetical protein